MSWKTRFAIIAHRGASAYEPENTIRAFLRAIEMGADAIEFDVRLSKDGVAVVVHDEDLSRIAGVNKRVRDLTSEELRRISVLGSDQHIPTLTEALDTIDSKCGLVIEIKDLGVEEQVVRALRERGLADLAIIISFHREALSRVKALDKGIETGIIVSRRSIHLADYVKRGYADTIFARYDIVTPRLVHEVKAAGGRVYVWTVNDPTTAIKMIGYGVNGIATDKPDLRHAIEKQKTLLQYGK